MTEIFNDYLDARKFFNAWTSEMHNRAKQDGRPALELFLEPREPGWWAATTKPRKKCGGGL